MNLSLQKLRQLIDALVDLLAARGERQTHIPLGAERGALHQVDVKVSRRRRKNWRYR